MLLFVIRVRVTLLAELCNLIGNFRKIVIVPASSIVPAKENYVAEKKREEKKTREVFLSLSLPVNAN